MKRAGTTLDVGGVPVVAFGSRATVWWGTILLIAVEGTTLACAATVYFYLRDNIPDWPLLKFSGDAKLVGTISVVLLLISAVPVRLSERAARRGDLRATRLWLIGGTAIALLFLLFRIWELASIPGRWDAHAHGSIVWIGMGLHLFHAGAGIIEDFVFLTLLARGPVQQKHRVDAQANAVYWYFVVLAWVPFYAVIYFDR